MFINIQEQELKVKDCRSSGKPASAWCKEHGIPYSTYMGWSRKFPTAPKETLIESDCEVKSSWFKARAGSEFEHPNAPERDKIPVLEVEAKKNHHAAIPSKAAIELRCGKWEVSINEDTDCTRLTEVLKVVNVICS